MPAGTSSLIAALVAQPDGVVELDADQCADLWEYLDQLPDPRKRRGRRHGLTAAVAVAVCAVLAGARSFAAIGEWAAGSYLVDTAQGDRFAETVAELADGYGAIEVELTGPWLPYSFAIVPAEETPDG